MRAKRVVFQAVGRVGFEEFEPPDPGRGEVLIRTVKTLISTGTELTILTGSYPQGSHWARYGRFPHRPGYSAVGVVEKLGEGVEGFKPGDLVTSMTGHAQYSVVDAGQLVRVPESVDAEWATFHTIAGGVINAVRLADISIGECVVVIGAGLLGQFATMFSRLSGAYPVITVDLSDFRLEKAKQSGAHITVNPSRSSVEEVVSRVTDGRMADIVFEVTGNPEVIPMGLRLTRRMGRFIVLSSPRGPSHVDFHDEVNYPSRVIIGAHFTSQPIHEHPKTPWTRERNRSLFLTLLAERLITVEHLITHRYPWFDAPQAYEMLTRQRTKALGVILDFTA